MSESCDLKSEKAGHSDSSSPSTLLPEEYVEQGYDEEAGRAVLKRSGLHDI